MYIYVHFLWNAWNTYHPVGSSYEWLKAGGASQPLTITDWQIGANTALPYSCISATSTGWLTDYCNNAKEFVCSTDSLKQHGGCW